jgi:hypothetical protein
VELGGDGVAIGVRERSALLQRERVLGEREVLDLRDERADVLRHVAAQLVVVPGRRRVRRQREL